MSKQHTALENDRQNVYFPRTVSKVQVFWYFISEFDVFGYRIIVISVNLVQFSAE